MAYSLLAKLLLLITTLATMSLITKANEDLMMQQCHNSNNPTLCLRCLNSYTTSQEADQVGLARIILKCVTTHLIKLTNNTSTMVSKHRRDPKAAEALKQCRLGYVNATRGVREADGHLISGDYDKAAYDVSMKVEYPSVTCSTNLVSLNVNVSSSFGYHTKVYLALTQALLRIIDRF
ncbi:unnamed protein product [Cochlearia groenlandica]